LQQFSTLLKVKQGGTFGGQATFTALINVVCLPFSILRLPDPGALIVGNFYTGDRIYFVAVYENESVCGLEK